MANQTTVDTAPLLAMPTSRPSLDQVRQIIGGERSGEFAPAYMPEYAGLRGIPAQAMVMPTQFSFPVQQAPVQQAPVQQAPAPVTQPAGRTFTPFVVPERKAVTAPEKDIYAGKPAITSAPIIGFTASGDPIYANVPDVTGKNRFTGQEEIFGGLKSLNLTAKDLEPSYLKNPIIGYTQNGLPIYASTDLGYVQRQPDYGNKEGGLISLARGGSVAQEAKGLAALGRGGDNMLVHMSPEEVSGLRALAMQQGTDLTINPDTGLPEAFKLKKLLRALAPIAPMFLGPTVGLAMKAALSGIIGGIAAPGKGFNFKEGLKTGLMAYAGGSLMENMQAANAAQAGPGTGGNVMTDAGMTGAGGAPPPPSPATGGPTPGVYGDYTAAATTTTPPVEALAPPPAAPTTTTAPSAAAPVTSITAPPSGSAMPGGIGGSAVVDGTTYGVGTGAQAPSLGQRFTEFTGVSPTTALIGGNLALSAISASKEADLYKKQAEAEREEEERKRALGLATFERSLGQVPTYRVASGGLIALARGGMPTFEYGGTTAPTGEPRMVKGAGDGMSDNVPANIEGVQEARLANDEFVVPADVVADIGNGSSSAGAKKLYAMMDRIRNARHGTTEQPPEISAERFMPA